MTRSGTSVDHIRSFVFRRQARATLVATVVLAALAAARAEISWMKPERVDVTPGAVLVMTLTSADQFGDPATPIMPVRVGRVEAQVGGQPAIFSPVVVAGTLSKFTATLTRPGVAVVEVELNPEARSISRSEVERYLRQLHATDEVRAAWEQVAPPNPWQEVRTIRFKTYARVGEPPAGDTTWMKARAQGLDLVPVQDPTAVKSGEAFAVRVERDGRPLAGAVVEYLSTGEGRQHVLISDEAGRVTAPLDAAGDWLIHCFDLQRVAAGNHDWDVGIVAVTVQAR